MSNVIFSALPKLLPFVDEHDALADTHYGVHIVGNDDGGDVEVFGDILDQVIDPYGGLRIETRVGFVAEKIVGVVDDGAGDADTLFHAAAYFRRHLFIDVLQPYALETEIDAVKLFVRLHFRQHIEGKHHVLLDVLRVEQRASLEKHTHLATYFDLEFAVAGIKIAAIIKDLAVVRL
jgi:hypothetical protein